GLSGPNEVSRASQRGKLPASPLVRPGVIEVRPPVKANAGAAEASVRHQPGLFLFWLPKHPVECSVTSRLPISRLQFLKTGEINGFQGYKPLIGQPSRGYSIKRRSRTPKTSLLSLGSSVSSGSAFSSRSEGSTNTRSITIAPSEIRSGVTRQRHVRYIGSISP